MKRATIRTESSDAELIARAIRPDNTDEMETRVVPSDEDARTPDAGAKTVDDTESAALVTTIERETTGGLRTNVDDYVVNVDVATQIIRHARSHSTLTDNPTHNHE